MTSFNVTSELSISTLKPAFKAAVARISEIRRETQPDYAQLDTEFYRQVGNSVFLTFLGSVVTLEVTSAESAPSE